MSLQLSVELIQSVLLVMISGIVVYSIRQRFKMKDTCCGGFELKKKTVWKIPEGVYELNEKYVAEHVDQSVEEVQVSADVCKIEADAFSFLKCIKAISLGSGIIDIEEGAFYCCRGLSEIEIHEGAYYVGTAAFSECSGLIKVVIANSVKKMGDDLFKGCGALETLVLPDGFFSLDKTFEDQERKRLGISSKASVIRSSDYIKGVLPDIK